MQLRSIALAGLAVALTACTTTPIAARNPIEAEWLGKEAGRFFAKFGPPLSDAPGQGGTLYSWRGGYKQIRVAARYEEGKDGKRGRQISPARVTSVSCSAQLTVSDDYKIRAIRIVSDRPGANGPSYCQELLVGNS